MTPFDLFGRIDVKENKVYMNVVNKQQIKRKYMFGSLFGLVTDVAKIVVAPVEIVSTLVSIPVKVVANVTTDLVNEVKSLKD